MQSLDLVRRNESLQPLGEDTGANQGFKSEMLRKVSALNSVEEEKVQSRSSLSHAEERKKESLELSSFDENEQQHQDASGSDHELEVESSHSSQNRA